VVWTGFHLEGDKLGFEQYMASRHVAAQFGDLRVPTFESRFFAAHGVERNIVVVASSFNALPPLVVGTQRITTVHARLARMCSRVLPVRVLEPPFAIPPLELGMQWNRHNDKDAAHAWMRRRLKAVAAEMVDACDHPQTSPCHPARGEAESQDPPRSKRIPARGSCDCAQDDDVLLLLVDSHMV